MNRSETAERFEGKTVAIVGSGPGSLTNKPGSVDDHDIVVRVNNYRLYPETGYRTDVFYSFFGTSIKKTREELIRDGVALCISKLPNAKLFDSEWHERQGKMIGVDYRPHYERRRNWWFCDTHIPSVDEFMVGFRLLGDHMPTTGFAAILDVLSFNPKSVFLTGFDFFRSKLHNVSDVWVEKNLNDPYRHMPEREFEWVADNIGRFKVDAALMKQIEQRAAA